MSTLSSWTCIIDSNLDSVRWRVIYRP